MIELHNVDCMEYLATLEDNAFELAIVDPPYGIDIQMQKFTKPSRPNSYQRKPKHTGFNDRATPNQDYFLELKRVSKNQIIWGAQYLCKFLDISGGW